MRSSRQESAAPSRTRLQRPHFATVLLGQEPVDKPPHIRPFATSETGSPSGESLLLSADFCFVARSLSV